MMYDCVKSFPPLCFLSAAYCSSWLSYLLFVFVLFCFLLTGLLVSPFSAFLLFFFFFFLCVIYGLFLWLSRWLLEMVVQYLLLWIFSSASDLLSYLPQHKTKLQLVYRAKCTVCLVAIHFSVKTIPSTISYLETTLKLKCNVMAAINWRTSWWGGGRELSTKSSYPLPTHPHEYCMASALFYLLAQKMQRSISQNNNICWIHVTCVTDSHTCPNTETSRLLK